MSLRALGSTAAKRRFCLVLVKPTHYCDDGYPIRWFRSATPSNSLACIYGIARDCAEQNVLAPDADIEIHVFDEANSRIRAERIVSLIADAGAGLVMLVGVQSNQMPRAHTEAGKAFVKQEQRLEKIRRGRGAPAMDITPALQVDQDISAKHAATQLAH